MSRGGGGAKPPSGSKSSEASARGMPLAPAEPLAYADLTSLDVSYLQRISHFLLLVADGQYSMEFGDV